MKRISTGVFGLDDMMEGGIPKNHVIAAIGSFGTGKSTLSLQFIYDGLKNGEKCIFISLDEGEEGLIGTAEVFGWDIKPYLKNGMLILVKLSAIDVKKSITRVQSELPNIIMSVGANRLAFDSITLFEMLFDSAVERRNRIFELCNFIKESGATALVTSEVDNTDPLSSKFGLIEYVVDGVVSLRYARPTAMQAVTLAIEVMKMRRTAHSRVIKPYEIGVNGIVVHSDSEVF